MKILAIAVLSMLSIPAASFAQAASVPEASAREASPRDLHAAQCVAALDVNTQELAKQVKSGDEAPRGLLLDRLLSGTAFVGDTYLNGNRDEKQARALADQALEAQKSLSAPELAARQAACAKEGAKLFAAGNGFEQAIMKRLAKKRMNKLLGA